MLNNGMRIMKKKILMTAMIVGFAFYQGTFVAEAKISDWNPLKSLKKQEKVSEQTTEKAPQKELKQEKPQKEKKESKFNLFKKKDKKQAAQAEAPKNITEASFKIAPKLIEDAEKKVKYERKDRKSAEKEKTNAEKREEEANITPKIQGNVEVNRVVSIDDCIKLALANNPNIQVQINNSEIYKTKIGQAWSRYFPTVAASLSYSRNDMLMTNFSFPMQTYNMFNTPQIQANQLIFDFGKTKASADIAKKGYESSKNVLQSSINDVVFSTKQAYYNLLYAMQQEKVYAKTVKDYELHLKQAKAYYDIGTKAKIDVTTAEYNLGSAKLNLIKSKNNIKMAYAQLNNAIGLPEYANYEVKDSLKSDDYSVTFDNAIEKAYEIRPELLSAKNKMEGSQILIKATARAFAPDLNAFGSYTLGGKSPTNDYGYQIGAQLAYQNTNFMMLKKQMDEAKATFRMDKANYEMVRQKVYLEIKQAYINYYNAKESIPVATLAMKQAKEQYELASGRYKVGMGDAVELKDAETTYRTAQLEYYNTLLNYNTAAANLEKSVGAPIDTLVGGQL